jgi:dimethylhistidine N-methyltransferase
MNANAAAPSAGEALAPHGQTAEGRTAFGEAVREGLSRRPRRLQPQYLYDELGSSLFEAICRLPWYPITRTEKRLLARHAGEIAAAMPHTLSIVELGCGTGEKLEILVDAFVEHGASPGVVLIDVSPMALERSARAIGERRTVPVVTYQDTYERGLARASSQWNGDAPRLVLFLGSNIGNFDPPDARRLLAEIRASIGRGDRLLLGVDLVKPAAVLHLAYDDPLGVTAAFNRNLLVRINRELGANFDLASFGHRTTWNGEHSRVEMHLVSLRDQEVRIPGAGCQVRFERGETIWTESSYKFDLAGIDHLAREAGFAVRSSWSDTEGMFAIALFDAI